MPTNNSLVDVMQRQLEEALRLDAGTGTDTHVRAFMEEVVRAATKPAPGLSRDAEIELLTAELERLRAIIHQPMTDSFIHGVAIEMEHQRTLHERDDLNKTPQAWYWTVGYLAGKALFAAMQGDRQKVQHHVITTAALCGRWHYHTIMQEHAAKVSA